MKIPALLMASLVTVGLSAQTSKPVKTTKNPRKVAKVYKPKVKNGQTAVKKDTVVVKHYNCPACGMG